jgi:hypothetical protein
MTTEKKPYDGLVGFYLHTFQEGAIEKQGQIIAMDGDTALVQLYSWIDGSPTIVVPMHKNIVYSDNCKLYATREDMHVGYQKEVEKTR